MGLVNQVAIIGTGTIRFGENFNQSYIDMVCEAASLAMADQLLGRTARMQVPGARTGLAQTLGGAGAVSCVAVLGQP